jgi:hypothetical protein
MRFSATKKNVNLRRSLKMVKQESVITDIFETLEVKIYHSHYMQNKLLFETLEVKIYHSHYMQNT